MRRSGIYRIELGNGNFYIGSSINLGGRDRQHRSDLRRGDHDNQIVQNCWNKYQVFSFAVLEECPISDLIVREQTYLDQHFDHPKNVNICSTAGSTLGVVYSDATKEKMSAQRKGMPKSAETRANMSAAKKGIPKSAETRANMSAAQKGKTLSNGHRANIVAAAQNMSVEARANISAANRRRWDKFRMEKLAMEEMDYGKKCS